MQVIPVSCSYGWIYKCGINIYIMYPFRLLECILCVKCMTNLSVSVLINHACVCPADIWSEQSFQTDPDLPPGWKKITDMAGIYYWHIPTGTTQWERPAPHAAPSGQAEAQALGDHATSTPRKHSLGSLSCSPTPDHEVSEGPSDEQKIIAASTKTGTFEYNTPPR